MVISERVLPDSRTYSSPWTIGIDQARRCWKAIAELSKPIPTPEWTTPNKIESTRPNAILRNFSNQNSSPDFPILILPPQAGHHSKIVDYAPDQSLVQAGLKKGASVYAIEWLGATPERKGENMDDLVESVDAAVDLVNKKGYKTNLIGVCSSGYLAAVNTALSPKKIGSLTCAVSPLDFEAGNGKIKEYAKLPTEFTEYLIALGGGNMPGIFISNGFKSLDIYEKVIKVNAELFQNIDDEEYVKRFQDFRNWNDWTQDIPGALYRQLKKELFVENRLIKGEFEVKGQKVDLSRTECPVILFAGEKDDITHPDQVLNAKDSFGSAPVKVIKGPFGHIGAFNSHKALSDPNYWPGIFDSIKAIPNNRKPAMDNVTSIFKYLPPKISA